MFIKLFLVPFDFKHFFMKKITTITTFLLCTFCIMLTLKSNGQALNSSDIKAELATDWQRAKDYTNEYLNTMPANKYNARAVDSLRSFAAQILHLAAANIFLMSIATGDQPLPWTSFDLESRKTAQSRDSVVYYVNASYDFCMSAVKNSDPNKWGEKVKAFGQFEGSRFAFMQKAFEHQTHHRGQTTIYIRLQNIKPPQEKLF